MLCSFICLLSMGFCDGNLPLSSTICGRASQATASGPGYVSDDNDDDDDDDVIIEATTVERS